MEYWNECVVEAFDDAKINATDKQVDAVASCVEAAHENYRLGSGAEVDSANYGQAEMQKLKDDLKREINKVTCFECKGNGVINMNYSFRPQRITCFKCHGVGRHDPDIRKRKGTKP